MELEYVISYCLFFLEGSTGLGKGAFYGAARFILKVLSEYSDFDTLDPGSILYLNRHRRFLFPFLFVFYFCCGPQFSAARARIGSYFIAAGGYRSLGQEF